MSIPRHQQQERHRFVYSFFESTILQAACEITIGDEIGIRMVIAFYRAAVIGIAMGAAVGITMKINIYQSVTFSCFSVIQMIDAWTNKRLIITLNLIYFHCIFNN